MEKWLLRLEKDYSELYKEIFNEISKLQIEEKFLERQAQSLVENIRKKHCPELEASLNALLESNDPDFILQLAHSEHISAISELGQSEKVSNILSEHFGSTDAELYIYK